MPSKSTKKPPRKPRVSLHPLNYDEAVAALLAVKPKTKTKKRAKSK